jgi:hypothetical protein
MRLHAHYAPRRPILTTLTLLACLWLTTCAGGCARSPGDPGPWTLKETRQIAVPLRAGTIAVEVRDTISGWVERAGGERPRSDAD